MKIAQLKSSVEKLEITPVVVHYARDAFIRVTIRSLTMSGSTEQVRWQMCQLGWYLVTQTVHVNLPDINNIL